MKKIISVILVVLLIVGCMPVYSFTVTAATSAGYVWPVDGGEMSQGWYPAGNGYGHSEHLAIDIAGVPVGTTVKAVNSGTVVCASTASTSASHICGTCHRKGAGYHVAIRHSDGCVSHYAHLSSVSVSYGTTVTAGQKIGGIGNTGNSNGAHLHFAIFVGGFGQEHLINPLTKISPFSSVYATNITSNSATLYGILGAKGSRIDQAGFYIGTSTGNMKKYTENIYTEGKDASGQWIINIFYGTSKWHGTLSPGTTYYYRIWMSAYGNTYLSDIYSFKTTGTSPVTPTVSQTTNCNYTLTVKANSGRIPLYDTATTYTESNYYYSNKTTSFKIYCTKKVVLSNGTVRYYEYDEELNRGFYVAWNPNIMTVVQKHTYSNSCDTSCNTCGATRSISHTYSNACDTSCNVCGATRSVSHTYSSICDITCNVCGKTKGGIIAFVHTYSNSCDGTCNKCDYTRTPPHSYKTYTTPATTAKDGTEVVKCSICSKVSSQRTIKAIKSIALSSTSAVYNGKRRTPAVVVKDSQGNIISANNYTVTYQSGRINVGKYKVTIKFKDNYSSTRNLYFTILPPKTTVSKLTAGRKNFTANISKKSSQVSGYQVQYATNTKFKNAKHKTIGSYKTTKYTFKNLTTKKTYYVRVRTYKTVNGKHYYSPWSAYKTVKTK